MKQEPEEYHELREALFLKAALVEQFSPRALLQEVIPNARQKDILLRAKLMSALREASTGSEGSWRMRPIQRRKILSSVQTGTSLPETGIGAALRGEGPWAAGTLGQMAADATDPGDLSRVVSTLQQAGPAAPGHVHLMRLSSRLDHLRREEATDALLGGGFAGREDEVSTLMHTLEHPQRHAPLGTLHIQGLPGVGKTFLLEHLGRLCRERPRIVMVRLDFDRSSLREGAVDAVFEEISRQIGTAMPAVADQLHDLRMERAERRTKIATETRGRVPFDLLHRMIDLLAAHDRQVLFLIDTLEVLHGHGATFVQQLFEAIDRFADKERIDISLISAGRGPVFARDDTRLQGFIALEELDDKVTAAILEKRNVPGHLRDRIISLSGGNPLRLILVARAVQESESGEDLGDEQIRFAGTGYLYRAILSRVPEEVRGIAAEGLILPELTPQILSEVVAPALDLEISPARADALLDTLEMQRWLVRRLPGGALVHIPEVRREILELTYAESPESTARINERAAAWCDSDHPDMALYHRLQLVRAGGAMPEVPAELARQLPDDLLEELTDEARDAVLRARGQRSRVDPVAQTATASPPPTVTRLPQSAIADQSELWLASDPEAHHGRMIVVAGEVGAAQSDAGSIADLRNMLELREKHEATYILKDRFARPFRLDSEVGLLALVHQWQSGHWSLARALFDKLPEETVLKAVREDISLTGLALLEIWAEFAFDRLSTRLNEDDKLREAVRQALSLTQRSGLRDGALAMAWLTLADPDQSSESGAADVVARYLPLLSGFSWRDMAQRCHALRAELGVSFAVDQSDPAALGLTDYARLAAPLNPYSDPLRALLEDRSRADGSAAMQEIAALGPALSELADLFAPGVEGAEAAAERAGARADEMAQLIGALGLTAEFATGYSFYTPLADLPTIARAAQRWQRVTMGLWRYGRNRPAGWVQTGADPLVKERTASLTDAGDPAAAALRMLRIWDDPEGDPDKRPPPVLRHRLARVYRRAAQETSPEARLRLLAGSALPAVVHAPVAVLAGLGVPDKDIFGT